MRVMISWQSERSFSSDSMGIDEFAEATAKRIHRCA
ncbi:hypothetical protein AN403_3094 [Pseudomonas fluorescens]|uniref:Uncharacterized protein n=1 Tax=Pseudomonas fluorescens TaxID=294 RepID=A0A0P8X1I5_PSEFL|nr:hypothetical protein AN403_3094 [Pseudomonas fluorescens]